MKHRGLTSLAVLAVLPLALAGCGAAPQGATTGAPGPADPVAAPSTSLGGPSQFCQAIARFETNAAARARTPVHRDPNMSAADHARQVQARILNGMQQDANDLAAAVPFAPADIQPDVIADQAMFQHMASNESTPIDEQPSQRIEAWVRTHCD